MKPKLSEFLQMAYKYNKVKDLEDAFLEYPVEDEWHKGKISNVIAEQKVKFNFEKTIENIDW